ncbi:MAG: oligosaccharide flippase family protein [bacterium]
MNQLKAGAALSYFTIAINLILVIVYTPFLLNSLGQTEYGIYALASSFIAYFTLLDFGFSDAVIRYTSQYIAEDKKDEQYKLFGMFFRLYAIVGIVALLFGSILYMNVDNLFGNSMTAMELDKVRVVVIIITISLALTFSLSIFNSIITAYQRFIFQKIILLFRIVTGPAIIVILLLLGCKSVELVLFIAILNLLILVVRTIYCIKKLKVKLLFAPTNYTLLKEVIIFSFWIFLNMIMDLIYWNGGQFLLGIYSGTKAIAIYALAIQFKNMFFMFSTAISSVFFPKITTMITQGANKKDISNIFIKIGRIQFSILILILSGFVVFGQQFIGFWAGAEYSNTYYIVLLIMVPSIILLSQNIGILIIQAMKLMKFASLVYTIVSIVSLCFAVQLIKHYGAIGCAISTSAGIFLSHGIIMNIYYKHKIKIDISRFWKEIFKLSILPICFSAVGVLALNYITVTTIVELLVYIVLYLVLYLPIYYFLSLNSYERDLIKSAFYKILRRE